MKILVIGGTGIIGGAISEAAVAAGHDVTVLSRRQASGKWKNIEASFVCGDWWNDETASEITEQGFDVIVDTLIFDEKNMDRSARIVNGHCTQFVYISTDSVYAHPASELSEDKEISMEDIRWNYGINKRKAELFLQSHSGDYSFNWTVIRPTITFGDTRIPVGFTSKRGTYNLIDRIEKGKPVLRFDDNKTRHSICHSSIFGSAAEALFLNERAYGHFYHICDDRKYTYGEIFSAIESILGKQAVFAFTDAELLRKYNADAYEDMIYDKNPEFTLDNSNIKGVCPDVVFHVELEDVLAETINSLRQEDVGTCSDQDYDLLTDLILTKTDSSSDYVKSLSDEQLKKISAYASRVRRNNAINGIKNKLRPIKRAILG